MNILHRLSYRCFFKVDVNDMDSVIPLNVLFYDVSGGEYVINTVYTWSKSSLLFLDYVIYSIIESHTYDFAENFARHRQQGITKPVCTFGLISFLWKFDNKPLQPVSIYFFIGPYLRLVVLFIAFKISSLVGVSKFVSNVSNVSPKASSKSRKS